MVSSKSGIKLSGLRQLYQSSRELLQNDHAVMNLPAGFAAAAGMHSEQPLQQPKPRNHAAYKAKGYARQRTSRHYIMPSLAKSPLAAVKNAAQQPAALARKRCRLQIWLA
ncbi:hypothetical protein NPIL_437841 [Nephila pilipes]|uniref:Uncharacterized protein n=1 Tax=Nephila pilipes TaxID=299642 RepID=A0A8X6NY06_NEPPI|nr:hypothetical protein NPIL_437841 [Nephila pilipes]